MDPFTFAVMAVAQIGIGMLFPAQGPRLKDLKVAASTYGAPLPSAFGVVRVAGNLIWADKIKEHKKKKRVGLKTFKYYVYTCTFAMSIGNGPLVNVRKVWANHKLIYDATGKGRLGITNKRFKMDFYLGTEDQMPAPEMAEIIGESMCPAYRGQAYVLFKDIRLEDFGNSLPQITVEVFGKTDGDGIVEGVVEPIALTTTTSITRALYTPGQDRIVIHRRNPAGLSVAYISSMMEEAASPPDLNFYNMFGPSPSTTHILVQGDRAGISNSLPFIVRDSVSFEEVARMGAESSGFNYTISGSSAAFTIQETPSTTHEYALYVSLMGDMCVFRSDEGFGGGLTQIDGIDYGIYGGHHKVGDTSSGQARFWVIMGTNSSTGTPREYLRVVEYSLSTGWVDDELIRIPNTANTLSFYDGPIFYNNSDNSLLVSWSMGSTAYMAKLDIASRTWVWQRSFSSRDILSVQSASLDTNELLWIAGGRLWRMNTLTGDFIRDDVDPFEGEDVAWMSQEELGQKLTAAPYRGYPLVTRTGAATTVSYDYQITDPLGGFIVLVRGSGISVVRRVVRPDPDTITLAGLVASLLLRSGMKPNQFDVSALRVQKIRGYGWASISDLQAILNQLRMVYMFDLVERDGVLTGVMRESGSNLDWPAEPVRTITDALMGTDGKDPGIEYFQEARIQDADIPRRVSISYMDHDRDFDTGLAQSSRIVNPVPTTHSQQILAIEVSVVFTPKEAKDQANRILWSQWAERTQHTTALPWAYIDLDPGDIVDYAFRDGRQFRDRLHETEFSTDWALQMQSYSQDVIAYESDVVVPPPTGPEDDEPFSPPRAAKAVILNTPLWRDEHDTGGAYSRYYVGVQHGGTTDFNGATVIQSTDSVFYNELYDATQDAEWASVQGALPPPRHGVFAIDWINKITVWPIVPWFELESVTDLEFYAGANLCAIGNELIQFRDVVENPDGSWTLSHLLRGRRGTEYACSTHKRGEMFFYLSDTTFSMEMEGLDQRGKTMWFKAISGGLLPEHSPTVQLKYEPRDLMPYAVKDIRRSIDGTDVTLRWKRRTRTGGNMQDGTGDVPLNEGNKQYEVYILKAAYAEDLSRSDIAPEPSQVYWSGVTSAEVVQFDTSDFGSTFDVNLDTLHVLIYQLSTAVGRGFPGVRSIEPWREF